MPVHNSAGVISVAAPMTRPANTTAYAFGQLVANSVSAGSVSPIILPNVVSEVGGVCRIDRIRVKKSNPSITNASFRLHLYRDAPASLAGDGAPWSTAIAHYVGAFDVIFDEVFSDGAEGTALPIAGIAVMFQPLSTVNAFVLIEARNGYAPASGETFTLFAETYRLS